MQDARTVADLGEHRLLERLRARLPAGSRDVLVPVGDDAAVVEPPRGGVDVLTTDALVEGVHFDLAFCSPADVGYKALAVSVSDLAAMGAQPRFALLSFGLPDALPVASFDGCVGGFLAAAAEHRVALIGGNLTRSPGPWFVDVTAVGAVRRRRVLARGTARRGDELYVTGLVGGSRAGLWWLRHGARDESQWSDELAAAVHRYRRPAVRVRTGVSVGRARAASACMDLSDGLADALQQMASASGLGAEVRLVDVPVHPAATTLWQGAAAREALAGGDDYELLFAVPPRRRRGFLSAVGHGRTVAVTRIGRMTDKSEGLRVVREDGSVEPLPAGFEHFAASSSTAAE
jgi:thiamine-monophosphate kinase